MNTDFSFQDPRVWDSAVDFSKFHTALSRFVDYLNTFDEKVVVKDHPYAKSGNVPVRYIPIETLEQLMDETFFGLWSVTDFETKAVGNEYIGSVTVSFFHPVARVWIHRVGAAAVLIKQNAWLVDENGQFITDDRGRKIKARPKPSDIDAKILNAMETGYPALLSGCISNAIKKIGRRLGRHLNRFEGYNIKDQTTTQTKFFAKKSISDSTFQLLVSRLSEAKELGDIQKLDQLVNTIDTLYNLTSEQESVFIDYKKNFLNGESKA